MKTQWISIFALVGSFLIAGCAMFDEISPRVFPGSASGQAARAQTKSTAAPEASLELFTLQETPEWAATKSGVSIKAGGFSGLLFLGKTDKGEYQFMTHTDRGPNAEPVKSPTTGKDIRPFVIPDFQPRWLMLETDRAKGSIKIVKEILLTDPKGKALTGLSGSHSPDDKYSDENPSDLAGNALDLDLGGIDPEGLAKDADGNFWMCEEYRPSLLKFSPSGKLLKRYIPKNSLSSSQLAALDKKWGPGHNVSNLPADYRMRRSNRGFEGLAFQNGKIYAIMQSSLGLPNSLHQKVVRVTIFDVKSESVTGELYYPQYRDGVEKMGDLSPAVNGTGLFAIEQNSKTGDEGVHLVTYFDVTQKATRAQPELVEFEALKEANQLVALKTISSLSEIGYDFAEKVEGLAMISESEFAIVNDNDFGVFGPPDLSQQTIPITTKRPTVLGIVRIHINN